MTNSLRIQRDRIALEALSGADIKSLLTNTFPQLLTGLTGFFDQFRADAPAITLSSKHQEFVREMGKHAYLDIAPIMAYVPEGLNVPYLKYSTHLMMAAQHASRVLTGPMSTYSVFLSQLITNTDQKFSSFSHEKMFDDLNKARSTINEELGACFKKGSTATERTIGDVVDRNGDWTHVLHNSDTLSNLINTVDRKALNKKIKECSELLDNVMAKMKRGEFEGMSPQAIMSLSNGAYQMAAELEFYSATYYKVLAYVESLNQTMQHFQKIFKK